MLTKTKCTNVSCAWVTHPYAKPRECLITRDPIRKALVFGVDAAGGPIVCENGDHPLLYSKEWHFLDGKLS